MSRVIKVSSCVISISLFIYILWPVKHRPIITPPIAPAVILDEPVSTATSSPTTTPYIKPLKKSTVKITSETVKPNVVAKVYPECYTIQLKTRTIIDVASVLKAINDERVSCGREPLTIDPELTAAAKAHLDVIASSGVYAHFQGDSSWLTHIKDTNYPYVYAGENLALPVQSGSSWGYFIYTEDVFSAWMASPTHRNNIIKPQYRETGIAVGNDSHGLIIVQMFANRK